MRIEPGSTVKIYKNIPYAKGHYLTFSSNETRDAFFEKHLAFTVSNCTMIRKTGKLRVSMSPKTLKDCNYISFKNPAIDDREYFCLINAVPDYINNECYEISYTLDPWVTFRDSFKIKDTTSISREHMSAERWTKAEANPYDPDLWELKTSENLPYDDATEDYNLTIDNYIFEGDSVGEDIMIVTLSPIDFTYLDSVVSEGTKPSETFNNFTTTLSGLTNGFVASGGKVTGGSGVVPNQSANLPTNFNTDNIILGIPKSAPETCSLEYLTKLLTQWNTLSARIGVYQLKTYHVFNAFRAYSFEDLTTYDVNLPEATDPKLANFPYSYLRIMTPSGDTAEYKYDIFNSAQSGEKTVSFYKYVDITSSPTFSLIPIRYKYEFPLQPQLELMDKKNIVTFSQIPEAPTTTDAYLAQVASVSAQKIASNTTENLLSFEHNIQNRGMNIVGNVISGTANLAGAAGIGPGVGNMLASEMQATLANTKAAGTPIDFASSTPISTGGVLSGMGQIGSTLLAGKQLKEETDLSVQLFKGAYDFIGGDASTAMESNLHRTRAAYATAIYTPPRGAGIEHYSDYGFLDLVAVNVSRNKTFADLYKKYFDLFGYTSIRIGVPYFYNFITGGTENLPRWVNGKTYIKCSDAEVECEYIEIADWIKAALETGMILINGDELNEQNV